MDIGVHCSEYLHQLRSPFLSLSSAFVAVESHNTYMSSKISQSAIGRQSKLEYVIVIYDTIHAL